MDKKLKEKIYLLGKRKKKDRIDLAAQEIETYLKNSNKNITVRHNSGDSYHVRIEETNGSKFKNLITLYGDQGPAVLQNSMRIRMNQRGFDDCKVYFKILCGFIIQIDLFFNLK